MGAGGVGACLGAHLTAKGGAQGISTALIARGEHLSAIRKDGLRLISPTEDLHVRPDTASEDPADAGIADVIFLTVKLYGLAQASAQILPIVGPETLVIPLQNGVTAAEEVGEIVGRERVLAGTTYISCFVTAPGVVTQKSPAVPIAFGEIDGGRSERVERLGQIGQAIGLDFRPMDAILSEIWRKFVAWSGFSILACLSRQSIGEILADAALTKLYRRIMEETVAVGRAAGVDLPLDLVDTILAMSANYAPNAKGSMREDLEAERPLEIRWLSGSVQELGRRFGIATPIHDVAAACLMPHEAGRR